MSLQCVEHVSNFQLISFTVHYHRAIQSFWAGREYILHDIKMTNVPFGFFNKVIALLIICSFSDNDRCHYFAAKSHGDNKTKLLG